MAQYKHYLGLAAVFVLAALVAHGEPLGIPSVLAQGAGQQIQGQLGAQSVGLMSVIGILISFMQVLGLIVLWMLQYLLSTDFLTDPVMLANLNQIWILSRDIMNLLFALMLIGVAIYTIITANREMVSSKLVHFVTAVILVNFSWFFPRVIIDIANILTSTIYSIPNMLPGFTCMMRDDDATPQIQPCKVLLNVWVLPKPEEEVQHCPNANDPNCTCLTGLVCYQIGDYNNALATLPASHAMINGLAVSFGRIAALAQVPGSVTGGIASGAAQNIVTVSLQLLVSTVLVFIVLAAITFPLVGLAIGLIIRMIILWVCVAFMPFAFLGYAWNGKLGVPGLPGEYDIWENFKTAAFLPAVVAIPFAIGFVMLSSTAQIPGPDNDLIISVPLVYGVSTWWGLMWLGAAIAIIYSGAFTALNSNKIIGNFTNKVKGVGDTLGSAAAQLPLLTPIPMPGSSSGERRTLGQVLSIPRALPAAIQNSAMTGKPLRETLEGIVKGNSTNSGINVDAAAKTLNTDNNGNTQRIVDAIQRLNNSSLTGEARNKELDELRRLMVESRIPNAERLTNQSVLPELRRIAERQGAGGRIGSNLGVIDGAIKQGTPR